MRGRSGWGRDYSRFLVGMISGSAAVQVQAVAVGWHVFILHHRPFDLGLVGLTLFLPSLTLWSVAGVFVDRHDRRAIAACGALLEAACSLALAALVLAREGRLWAYLLVLLGLGIVRAFAAPAERALLPGIVGQHRYAPAQATYASLRECIVIGGPAIGGLLVAIGTPFAFAGAAGLSLVGAAALGSLPAQRAHHHDVPTLRSAFDGVRYIATHPVVAGAISLDLFAVLFGGVTALLPVYADAILHIGPVGLGVLRSAPAAGAACVAWVLSRRPLQRRIGPTLLVAVAVFGIATVLFGLSRNTVLSVAMLAIVGGSDMVSVIIRNVLVQLGTPDAMRGRVNAVENVFIGASNELGEFESGTLAALVGTVPSVVIGGAATLFVIVLWALLFPALRRTDGVPRSADAVASAQLDERVESGPDGPPAAEAPPERNRSASS